MHASSQNHLGTSKYRLGGKLISLLSWHSLCDCCVCHCFNEHKNICGGASADCSDCIHQTLRDYLCASEAVGDGKNLVQILFGYAVIGAGACHAFAYLCRGIGHQAYHFQRLLAFFFQPCKSFAGGNSYDHVIWCQAAFDLADYFFVELRLHS